MSECFICSTNHRVCKDERKKGEKAPVKFVRVSDAYYKRYIHPRNVNKTVIVNDKCAGDQPN